jgi:hypothetical protein
MSAGYRLLVLGLLISLCAVPAAAAPTSTTITLQNGLSGYAGTTDTWLDASQTRDNYGGAAALDIRWNNGRSDCALVKFDLTGKIPAGAAVLSATLSLYYMTAVSFSADNAVALKPYRLQAGAGWDENVYDGQYGVGASYRYRDEGETAEWTGGAEGGWYDKVDDSNGTAKIKRADGTPPDAVAPQNWVSFDVTTSVTQWKAGAENNGFLVVAVGFQGSGTTCYGTFTSRNDSGSSYRPKLTIVYEPPVATTPASWGRIKDLYR